MSDLSDFEKQRAANIAERDALLKKLSLEADSTGLLPQRAPGGAGTKKPQPKKRATASSASSSSSSVRVKKEQDQVAVPRRTSARLAGVKADNDVAKRKHEEQFEAAQAAAEVKRQRVAGDLDMGAITIHGSKWNAELLGLASVGGGGAAAADRYQRTFGKEDVEQTTDHDLKREREKLMGLKLWEGWEPNQIKITPERIYCMSFHPNVTKPLIFAGDKLGNLGILDASQKPGREVKAEEDENDNNNNDVPDPEITTIKPHSRTISALHTHPKNPGKLYMASYDSSIRILDLEKSVAVEAYAPSSISSDEPISGIDMAHDDDQCLYFTTLEGVFGRHDTRTGSTKNDSTDLYELSEKKIGGFSLCPSRPNYFTTASLDRTMRLWDIRKLSKDAPTPVGEHESSYSVSHAAFNAAGQVASTSYDNTVKIYDFGAKGLLKGWEPGHTLSSTEMKPDGVVRHNCQTGRWVTILRPQWQASPSSGVQRFCVGNMNRFVDVYSSSGDQLAQLGGDGLITAVPAVAVFHPTLNWVVGGTASGKVCLWM